MGDNVSKRNHPAINNHSFEFYRWRKKVIWLLKGYWFVKTELRLKAKKDLVH